MHRVRQYRQQSAYHLGHNHSAHHRHRNRKAHGPVAILPAYAHKIDRRKYSAHGQGNSQLLPYHAWQIPYRQVAGSQSAYHHRAGLTARVTAGIRQHRYERDQQRHGAYGGLKPGEYAARYHARYHEHQQPYYAVAAHLAHARLEIALFGMVHAAHGLEVFGGLPLHYVHGVVHRYHAHQPSLVVHYRER